MTAIEFSVAAFLLAGYGLFLMGMLGIVLSRTNQERQKVKNAETLEPEIRDALVDYLAGNNDQTRIREFVKTNRSSVGDVILTFHGTVAGSARDRLCDLALELTLVHDWCQDTRAKEPSIRRTAYARLAFVCAYEPCRRVAGDLLLLALKDQDPEVRVPAARALVQSGEILDLVKVFHLAIEQNVLIRALLTEDLRRHAGTLSEHAVPEALKAAESQRVLAALQILVAWERALGLTEVHALLDSRNREIRMEALRLAPLVPLTPPQQAGILRALADPDPEISTVAALSAGVLRLQEALPSLARCVRTGTAESARIAAAALASMPPKGWQTLEELASGPNPNSAFIAAEALERGKRKAGL